MATLDEAKLARAAAAGDGQAFARLYDEYEGRIYNFCVRLVGAPEDAADATQDAFLKVLQRLPKLPADRELNFGAYLFTAARNASYDVIGKRKRADPVDLIPESGARGVGGIDIDERGALDLDPERATMLGALQAQVQAANARLPERQREVLALRELEELSYDEIAEIMDMNRNSVAQLISRARIRLRDEVQGSALASIPSASPACAKALPLISLRQDGQLSDGGDRQWLEDHVADCPTCRVSVEAMAEAGMSYRAWAPVLPLAWLWKATAAKAMDLTGSDWNALLDRQRDLHSGGAGSGSGSGSGSGLGAASGAGAVSAAGTPELASATETASHQHRRRRRATTFAGAMLVLLAAALLFLGREEVPATLEAGIVAGQLLPPTVSTPPVPTTPAPAAPKPKAAPKKAKRAPAKRQRASTPRRSATPVAVFVAPTPAAPYGAPYVAPYVPPRATVTPPKPASKPKPTGSSISASSGVGSTGSAPPGTTPTVMTTTPDPVTTPASPPAVTVDPTPGATYCQQNPADPKCRPCPATACRRADTSPHAATAAPAIAGSAAVSRSVVSPRGTGVVR
ncbi:MAG: sigma-70 family polymerase sigma factor [Solirubrobacterales bacterium]|nr:sigma-70 family polymerase sigma factor [Solirubrobacterales bacterium]